MTPRCVEPGCPIRFSSGDDRPCSEHRNDDRDAVLAAAEALGIFMQAAPGDRDEVASEPT
jgi:hypothetical protein